MLPFLETIAEKNPPQSLMWDPRVQVSSSKHNSEENIDLAAIPSKLFNTQERQFLIRKTPTYTRLSFKPAKAAAKSKGS